MIRDLSHIEWGKPIDGEDLDKTICYFTTSSFAGDEGIVFWSDKQQRWQGYFRQDRGWPDEDARKGWEPMAVPFLEGPAWSDLPSHPCGSCDGPVYFNDYLCGDCRTNG